jgi:hypothetical protein
VFAVLYDVIGDSAVIVRFEENRRLCKRGKIVCGRRPGDGAPRRGSAGWRCKVVSQISLCRNHFCFSDNSAAGISALDVGFWETRFPELEAATEAVVLYSLLMLLGHAGFCG